MEQSKYTKVLSKFFLSSEQCTRELFGPGTCKYCRSLALLLQDIFKQFTGFSPVQYQNFIKMHHAYDLLTCEHYTISKCRPVGINDEFYFSRLFSRS
jgi:hypothetical protein